MAILDTFSVDPDGTRLNAHNADSGGSGFWVESVGPWTIQSGKAQAALFVTGVALRPETFPNDHYAQCLTRAVNGEATYAGAVVRSTIFARLIDIAGTTNLELRDSGGFLNQYSLGVASGTFVTVKLVAAGGFIDAYVDTAGGTAFGASLGHVATVDTVGKPGITANTNATQPTIDNFECTDPVGSGGPIGARMVRSINGIRVFGAGQ